MNSFNECTQILRSSEIKNKSEKEEKVELTGCCICSVHFCSGAYGVNFAFFSPLLLKPWSLLIPSVLVGLLKLLYVFYAVIFTCTKRYCKPIYWLCIASPFTCHLSKETCNISISNLYFRFYKSSRF